MNNTALKPYLRDIRSYPLLSHEDEVSLVKAFRNGSDQAAEKLVTANLRFVVSIAKNYQHLGLPLADLISEGNIGLIKALERFDETRGIKFSWYASWVIKRQIMQALADTSRIVRIPMKQIVALYREQRKLQHLSKQLRQHNANSDTLRYLDQQSEAIQRTLNATYPYLSLDTPLVSDDETHTFLEFLPEDEEKQPDSLVFQKISRDFVCQALSRLCERDRRILEMYYGFYDQKPKTLQAIGEIFGITRERVRQIKKQALDTLRHTLHAQN